MNLVFPCQRVSHENIQTSNMITDHVIYQDICVYMYRQMHAITISGKKKKKNKAMGLNQSKGKYVEGFRGSCEKWCNYSIISNINKKIDNFIQEYIITYPQVNKILQLQDILFSESSTRYLSSNHRGLESSLYQRTRGLRN